LDNVAKNRADRYDQWRCVDAEGCGEFGATTVYVRDGQIAFIRMGFAVVTGVLRGGLSGFGGIVEEVVENLVRATEAFAAIGKEVDREIGDIVAGAGSGHEGEAEEAGGFAIAATDVTRVVAGGVVADIDMLAADHAVDSDAGGGFRDEAGVATEEAVSLVEESETGEQGGGFSILAMQRGAVASQAGVVHAG